MLKRIFLCCKNNGILTKYDSEKGRVTKRMTSYLSFHSCLDNSP